MKHSHRIKLLEIYVWWLLKYHVLCVLVSFQRPVGDDEARA